MDRTVLGPRLRRIRLERGLSQSQLQVRSGIPKSRLSRYENGWLLPSLPTLMTLAEALHCSVPSLIGPLPATPDFLDVFLDRLTVDGLSFDSAAQATAAADSVSDRLQAEGTAARLAAGQA